jgi:NAD(P)-dependent dehydrogenase (short-subunit alcohol dehydrogenase family)
VTGAGGHIGSAVVAALAERSFVVAVNDIDEGAARELADSIDGALPFAADVSDPDAATRLVEEVRGQVGAVDVLVNGAGIEGPIGSIEHLLPSDVRRVFDVNVMSVFWLCRAAVPAMKQARKGRIVNLASGAGLAGGARASAYHASKHAVVGLTRSLARELAPYDVAVNAVCPGYVESPMVDRIIQAETQTTGEGVDVVQAIPMGRMADRDEVAATIAFLARDAPVYMTGSCLVIDGALRA